MTTDTTAAATSLADRARAALADRQREAEELAAAREEVADRAVADNADYSLYCLIHGHEPGRQEVTGAEWTQPATSAQGGSRFTTTTFEDLDWQYVHRSSTPLMLDIGACADCGSVRWRPVAVLADIARVLDADDTGCDRCDDEAAEAAELALAPEQRAEIDAPHPHAEPDPYSRVLSAGWLDRADEHADHAHDCSDPTDPAEWWHHAVLSAVDSLLVIAHMLHRRGEVR